MKRQSIVEAIPRLGFMVLMDRIDPNFIKELLEAGVRIFELRFSSQVFFGDIRESVRKLREIVGGEAYIGIVGLNATDQIEACASLFNDGIYSIEPGTDGADFFTPGPPGINDDCVNGVERIDYACHTGDILHDSGKKPVKLVPPYPGIDYQSYMAGLLARWGPEHKLIAMSDIFQVFRHPEELFEAGACALEVNASKIRDWSDSGRPYAVGIGNVASRIISGIEPGKAAYLDKLGPKMHKLPRGPRADLWDMST